MSDPTKTPFYLALMHGTAEQVEAAFRANGDTIYLVIPRKRPA